jgi:hypothetical protein
MHGPKAAAAMGTGTFTWGGSSLLFSVLAVDPLCVCLNVNGKNRKEKT